MKNYVLPLLLLAGLAACKKDEETSSATKAELLTATAWYYNNGGIGTANGDILFDFNGLLPACYFDNSVKFDANGTGIGSENSNVCPNASPTVGFNWALQNHDSVLNVTGNALVGLGGIFRVKEISGARLSLIKDTTVSGQPTSLVFNLKH